jgi:proline iminopeptidase
MNRNLAILAAVLLVVIAGGGTALWYVINTPLYQPGMVSAGTNLSASLDPPAQGTEPGYWEVEKGIKLHYFAAGLGENVLVIHGGPGQPSLNPWPGLNALTDKYRFVYYDQRGSGRSTRPINRFTSSNYYQNMKELDRTLGLGAQIADIERVRRILGGKKLVIIGHSFGGFLAALYTAEFPQNVKALILVAPADVLVMPQQGRGFFAEIEDRLAQPMKSQFEDYLKRYLDYADIFTKSEAEIVSLNAEFAIYYFAAAKTPGVVPSAAADDKSGGGWMVHAMYFSMGRRHDYRSALKAINMPVLIIHASDDLQPEEVARMYVDAIPNAQLEVIRNARHMVFIDQPEAFATVVGGFLAKVK